MKYKTLLFDADDTLLDFQANQYDALTNLFNKLGYEINDDLREKYNIVNHGLWRQYEEGHIPKEAVLNTRFSSFFETIGIHVDGKETEKLYRQNLNQGAQLIPGAIELCEKLYNTYDLYIVTNGERQTQEVRFKKSGLDKYFKDIFISEAIGYPKPNREFFDYVFNKIENFNKDNSLIIGDSLNSDIKGGINAGIDTCWYNPSRIINTIKATPTYEITTLEEIYEII